MRVLIKWCKVNIKILLKYWSVKPFFSYQKLQFYSRFLLWCISKVKFLSVLWLNWLQWFKWHSHRVRPWGLYRVRVIYYFASHHLAELRLVTPQNHITLTSLSPLPHTPPRTTLHTFPQHSFADHQSLPSVSLFPVLCFISPAPPHCRVCRLQTLPTPDPTDSSPCFLRLILDIWYCSI